MIFFVILQAQVIQALRFIFFAVGLSISFKFSSFSLMKARQILLMNRKCKGHERQDQLLVSNEEFGFQIPSEIKNLLIDPVFLNWVTIIKNASIRKCSRNPKSCKGIYFFLEILKFFFEIFS